MNVFFEMMNQLAECAAAASITKPGASTNAKRQTQKTADAIEALRKSPDASVEALSAVFFRRQIAEAYQEYVGAGKSDGAYLKFITAGMEAAAWCRKSLTNFNGSVTLEERTAYEQRWQTAEAATIAQWQQYLAKERASLTIDEELLLAMAMQENSQLAFMPLRALFFREFPSTSATRANPCDVITARLFHVSESTIKNWNKRVPKGVAQDFVVRHDASVTVALLVAVLRSYGNDPERIEENLFLITKMTENAVRSGAARILTELENHLQEMKKRGLNEVATWLAAELAVARRIESERVNAYVENQTNFIIEILADYGFATKTSV